MARVLVLGADGMVGHVARIYLAERGHEVSSIARSESAMWDSVDVEDERSLWGFIERKNPDVVVNCVGVLVRESEADTGRAIRLNALLPWTLAKNGPRMGYRLIQISTDCVFSGASGPYREGDRRDEEGVYGRTKSLGEVVNTRDLTIRTSKVGPELREGGAGLFHWFMMSRQRIKGYSRAMWSGVTTLEAAKALEAAIQDGTTGLVHLTNGEPISKYDLLRLFKETWNRDDLEILRDDTIAIDRSLLNSRGDYRYHVPGYREMLEELRAFMISHSRLYRHYGLNRSGIG